MKSKKWLRKRDDELKDAEIYTSWQCNLNCPTCVQRGFKHKYQGMLTREHFTAFLDSLERQGHTLRTMDFQGGEPTIWPHLRWAINEAKGRGITKKITVLTNALHARPEDFDGVDLVRVTDYGAINRKYILRLMATLPRRRVRSSWVIHREVELYGPKRTPEEAWPAKCSSPSINLGPEGTVYGCGANAIEQEHGIPVDEDFVKILRGSDPRRQERCLNCPSNHRLKHQQYGDKELLGLAIGIGIWGTPIGRIWHLRWADWWRWRYLWSRYYRRGIKKDARKLIEQESRT